MTCFGQLLQMILEIVAFFSSMPFLLMISTEPLLVTGRWIPAHLWGPFEEWLVLNLEQDFIKGVFEDGVDPLVALFPLSAVFLLPRLLCIFVGYKCANLC